MPLQIASFDVFDTLLTRTTGSPESTFLAFGQRLESSGFIPCSAAAFASLRAQAEHRTFDNNDGLDSNVTLRDIYAELVLGLDIDAHAVMQQELLFEREHLQVIEHGRQRLEQARRDGQKIAFVSDMYLSQTELGGLLDNFDLRRSGDALLVSSAHRLSKRSGRLFGVLLANESVRADEVIHHGNDATSDIKMPNRLGIATQPFLQGNFNRVEKILDRAAISTDGFSGALAGASRLSRLSINAPTPHERAIVDTASAVAAPIVIGFVLWTLKRAMADNVKQLYFIARDGQLLLAVAKVLARKIGCQIHLKYLHGSRRSWQLAALDPSIENAIATMLPDTSGTSFVSANATQILDRFDVHPNEIRTELAAIGLDSSQWQTDLSARQVDALNLALTSNADVHSLLIARSDRARDTVLDYFRQHGLTEKDCGIVDLGTGGTLLNALADLLESVNAPVPQAYYLGQRNTPPHLAHWRVPQVYLFDTNHSRGLYQQRGLIGYLEAVCSADHGTTTGYQRVGDEVVPVLTDGTTDAVRQWGHPLVFEAVVKVARHLAIPLQPCVSWQADIRSVSMQCFECFWHSPTMQEAQAWGSFPFDDGHGKHVRQLTMATRYGIKDAITAGEPHRHWWHGGALALSSPLVRFAFQQRDLSLKAVRRIRRKFSTPATPTERTLAPLDKVLQTTAEQWDANRQEAIVDATKISRTNTIEPEVSLPATAPGNEQIPRKKPAHSAEQS